MSAKAGEFHGAGFGTHIAKTGHEAVRLAEHVHPDAAVLDLGLPGLYGTSVAFALRNQRRDLPIIIMSALPQPVVAKDAWSIGAIAYFTKPFEPEQLINAVERAIGGLENDRPKQP